MWLSLEVEALQKRFSCLVTGEARCLMRRNEMIKVFFIQKFSMKKRTAKPKEHWYRRHLQQQFFGFLEKWKIQRRHVWCLQTQRLGTTAKAQRSPPTEEFKLIVQQLLNKTFQHRERQSGVRFSERQKCSLTATHSDLYSPSQTLHVKILTSIQCQSTHQNLTHLDTSF